jgi:hypothetical protein
MSEGSFVCSSGVFCLGFLYIMAVSVLANPLGENPLGSFDDGLSSVKTVGVRVGLCIHIPKQNGISLFNTYQAQTQSE